MRRRVNEIDLGLVRCWPNIPLCNCKNQEIYAKLYIQVSRFFIPIEYGKHKPNFF